jgi:uncharacterized membrane protein YozB (DUF420 family)
MLFLLLAAHPIVHVNASLNVLATILLLVGLMLIKRGRVTAHKRVMLSAFVVSIAFLTCYSWYHAQVGRVEFTHPGLIKTVYKAVLYTHIPLAAMVPFLAAAQMYLGFHAIGCCVVEGDAERHMAAIAAYRQRHRRLARWTFPIWLYVSVTGVIVYVMLYHLWPPE